MPAIQVKPASPRLRRGRESSAIYAAWPLAHRSTPARDYVGSNPLIFNGALTWTTGLDGPAVSFPGAGTAFLQTTGNVLNPFLTDFTAAIWFRTTSASTSQALLQQQDGTKSVGGTGTGRTWLSLTGAGKLTAFIGGAATTGTTTITVNTDHLAVIACLGSLVSIYLDGFLEASASHAAEDNAAELRIGAGKTGLTPLSGIVGRSGVALWARALSATEVLRQYTDPYRMWTPRRRWAELSFPTGDPFPVGRRRRSNSLVCM